MENRDVRWTQRFPNFQKALTKLEEVVSFQETRTLSELEKEGMIQRFEYTFELAWKTLRDLLLHKGYLDISGPGPVLEQSLADGFIKDEEGWRSMKKSRELTSHTYNNDTTTNIANRIGDTYFGLLHDLCERLKAEENGKQTNRFS